MRVEILCTGDEILSGKTVNTNYSHIARRLGEVGLDVQWGTTVGDDRAALLQAFRQAGERADAVIVNGGLGPTVDDLSQEVAAEACGVPLVLSDHWLERMTQSYARRGRVMPANNKKQAMLPENAEFIDNPIGTACGFAVTIGKARFLFTPGVPREMKRMLDEQVIPRLLKLAGMVGVTRLKRFHTYGIGESRADELLAGIPGLAIDGDVKLGFQAHYPQLETKLAVRGADTADLERRLGPVEAEVRRRLGNFVVAEDDETLEGVVLAKLLAAGHTLAVAETFTGGQIAARLAPMVGAEAAFRRGTVTRRLPLPVTPEDAAKVADAETFTGGQIAARLAPMVRAEAAFRRGTVTRQLALPVTPEDAAKVADAERKESGASHALAVLVQIDEGGDRPDFGATICIGIADAAGSVSRRARLVGGRDWVRIGAAELALDCLRRHLLGLPVDERIDFERR